jgi:hypothetical protein
VAVRGTEPAVVEIGQQLAWLGATLRSSLSADKICSSEPEIEVLAGTKPLSNYFSKSEKSSPTNRNRSRMEHVGNRSSEIRSLSKDTQF